MKISVVIPSVGRTTELLETVEALLVQTHPPSEILIIDQNQPPLKEIREKFTQFKTVRHLTSQTLGVAYNENVGICAAKGDILLFVDDDIIPCGRLIEYHLRHYEKDPHLGGVAGRVTQPVGDRAPSLIRKVGAYSSLTGGIQANFNYKKPTEVEHAPGGNMSFRKEVLEEIGGCDLGFDGNGYRFETDLGLRVRKAGYRILFDPEAEVEHLMAPRGGARIPDKALHTYYYVKNGLRLYRKHSPEVGQPFFAARMAAYVLAKSLKNRDLKILNKGLAGVWKGLTESVELKSNLESEDHVRSLAQSSPKPKPKPKSGSKSGSGSS